MVFKSSISYKGEETDTNETVPTETEPEPAVIEQPMTEELLESEAESESILEDSSEEMLFFIKAPKRSLRGTTIIY